MFAPYEILDAFGRGSSVKTLVSVLCALGRESWRQTVAPWRLCSSTSQPGQHQTALQTLPKTMGAPPGLNEHFDGLRSNFSRPKPKSVPV